MEKKGNNNGILKIENNKKTKQSSKPVLIEHDFIDWWRVIHLMKVYAYRYSLQQSHQKNIWKKVFM